MFSVTTAFTSDALSISESTASFRPVLFVFDAVERQQAHENNSCDYPKYDSRGNRPQLLLAMIISPCHHSSSARAGLGVRVPDAPRRTFLALVLRVRIIPARAVAGARVGRAVPYCVD